MTRRVLHQIHMKMAADKYWTDHLNGVPGDIALRAQWTTEAAARAAYRALPWWRRMF